MIAHSQKVYWSHDVGCIIANVTITHECFKISSVGGWCFGSVNDIFLTKSFALLDIEGQGLDKESLSPRNIAANISISLPAENGGTPVRRMRRVTLALQISALGPKEINYM